MGTRVGTGCPVSSLFLIVLKHSTALLAHNFLLYLRYKMVSDGVNWSKYVHTHIERLSYDLEMKTREQNRNNKRTEIKRFDWFIERIQTHLAFGWLSDRSVEKTSCPKNFLEIALTSYCNTIGQSNNAFSILGFSLAGKRGVRVLFFSSIG